MRLRALCSVARCVTSVTVLDLTKFTARISALSARSLACSTGIATREQTWFGINGHFASLSGFLPAHPSKEPERTYVVLYPSVLSEVGNDNKCELDWTCLTADAFFAGQDTVVAVPFSASTACRLLEELARLLRYLFDSDGDQTLRLNQRSLHCGARGAISRVRADWIVLHQNLDCRISCFGGPTCRKLQWKLRSARTLNILLRI